MQNGRVTDLQKVRPLLARSRRGCCSPKTRSLRSAPARGPGPRPCPGLRGLHRARAGSCCVVPGLTVAEHGDECSGKGLAEAALPLPRLAVTLRIISKRGFRDGEVLRSPAMPVLPGIALESETGHCLGLFLVAEGPESRETSCTPRLPRFCPKWVLRLRPGRGSVEVPQEIEGLWNGRGRSLLAPDRGWTVYGG